MLASYLFISFHYTAYKKDYLLCATVVKEIDAFSRIVVGNKETCYFDEAILERVSDSNKVF